MTHPRRVARGLLALGLAATLSRLTARHVASSSPDGGQADRTCASPATFHPARVDPVFLPALDVPSASPPCEATVHVQNVGDRPGRAMLWLFGPPGDCFLNCRPPLAIVCSGLIGAGATWAFDRSASAWPDGAVSGVLFSLAATADASCLAFLSADGPTIDLSPPNCAAYRRFRSAWDSGESAGGAPLRLAYGPPIVAHAERRCPDAGNKLMAGTGAYEGVAGRQLAGYDRVAWVGTYAAPVVLTAPDPTIARPDGADSGPLRLDTWLTVQNAGGCCAAIEIWFQSRDACQPDALCLSTTLPSGASLRYRASDCRSGPWAGNAWIRGSEPLGVVVDVVGADRATTPLAARTTDEPAPPPRPPAAADGLASYVAPPADLRPTFSAQPIFTAGSAILHAPWLRGGPGARSRLTVQNMAADRPAHVRLTVRAAGQSVDAVADLCPRGSITWDTDALPTLATLPGDWTGDARVESLADPAADEAPPNLVGVIHMTARPTLPDDPPPSGTLAYELSAVPLSGRAKAAARLIALPNVDAKRTSIRVTDLAGGAGGMAFGLFLFDANGLVAVTCHRLPPFGVANVNIGTPGGRGMPFHGAALISAAAWGPPPSPARGRIAGGSLAALALHTATADHGDPWSATAGLPLPPDAPVRRLLADVGPLACARERGWGEVHAYLPALLGR